ncbi:MAG: ribose-5-phosphate isomerase RpiA [Magnetospiraceae bacterium]
MWPKNVQDQEKRAAGEAAAELVKDGMLLGIGTGSTVAFFIDALGARVAAGLSVSGIPTSEATAAHCTRLGIPLVDFKEVSRLDLTVDGADEVDQNFQMIKGGGGALLREKLVAEAANHVAIIADSSKRVETLGAFPLPVEIVRFAHEQTCRRIAALGIEFNIRQIAGIEFITDNGNLILDCRMASIPDPIGLHKKLIEITGVVETGLFINLCQTLVIGRGTDTEVFENPQPV